jgi:hypothetical protein
MLYIAVIIIYANGQTNGSRKNDSVSASEGFGLGVVSSSKSKVSVSPRSRKIVGGSRLG